MESARLEQQNEAQTAAARVAELSAVSLREAEERQRLQRTLEGEQLRSQELTRALAAAEASKATALHQGTTASLQVGVAQSELEATEQHRRQLAEQLEIAQRSLEEANEHSKAKDLTAARQHASMETKLALLQEQLKAAKAAKL